MNLIKKKESFKESFKKKELKIKRLPYHLLIQRPANFI